MRFPFTSCVINRTGGKRNLYNRDTDSSNSSFFFKVGKGSNCFFIAVVSRLERFPSSSMLTRTGIKREISPQALTGSRCCMCSERPMASMTTYGKKSGVCIACSEQKVSDGCLS